MKKIVLVEDDPDILFAVKLILQNSGYEVTAMTSAMSIMNGHDSVPDLYILDKRMPDMDGLDVCRYLRSVRSSRKTPVIIISASPDAGVQAIGAGANDFLEKPFHLKTLVSMVEKYIPNGSA